MLNYIATTNRKLHVYHLHKVIYRGHCVSSLLHDTLCWVCGCVCYGLIYGNSAVTVECRFGLGWRAAQKNVSNVMGCTQCNTLTVCRLCVKVFNLWLRCNVCMPIKIRLH